jgi:hypothetical protein
VLHLTFQSRRRRSQRMDRELRLEENRQCGHLSQKTLGRHDPHGSQQTPVPQPLLLEEIGIAAWL